MTTKAHAPKVDDIVWVSGRPGTWTVESRNPNGTAEVWAFDEATRAAQPDPTHWKRTVPLTQLIRPVDPTCVSREDAATLAAAMHPDARQELLWALEKLAENNMSNQLVIETRAALEDSMPDRSDIVGVVFKTTEWDNGSFFDTNTAIVVGVDGTGEPFDKAVTHGKYGEMPAEVGEQLTEMFGCVSHNAVAVVDLRRGTVECNDSYYDGGDGYADLFPEMRATDPAASEGTS
jgi:hypothetical protein